jgi:hypothetical protein
VRCQTTDLLGLDRRGAMTGSGRLGTPNVCRAGLRLTWPEWTMGVLAPWGAARTRARTGRRGYPWNR